MDIVGKLYFFGVKCKGILFVIVVYIFVFIYYGINGSLDF